MEGANQERPSGARAQRDGNQRDEGFGLGLDDDDFGSRYAQQRGPNTAASSNMTPSGLQTGKNEFFPTEGDDEFPIKELTPIDNDGDDAGEEFSSLRQLIADIAEPILPPDEDAQHQTATDFIRSFLVARDMESTYNTFQAEWYGMRAEAASAAEAEEDPQKRQVLEAALRVPPIPQVYIDNQRMADTLRKMRAHLEETRIQTEAATSKWHKYRRQRDYHKMHHQRVSQQKNKLVAEFARLQSYYQQYEPTMTELRQKFEVAMKAKMMIEIDRDKQQTSLDSIERNLAIQAQTRDAVTAAQEFNEVGGLDDFDVADEVRPAHWPPHVEPNPNPGKEYSRVQAESFTCRGTFPGHAGGIGKVCLHPTLPMIATASDDKTWKMWNIPKGELVMSGTGHTDWVSSLDIHPNGMYVASGGGDQTVRIWDLSEDQSSTVIEGPGACNGPIWDLSFHAGGDFLAAASQDKTCRIFDAHRGDFKQKLAGHVDAVNSVQWQPYANNLLTGSADKTISLWDLRSGLCIQTFYGHSNAVNKAKYSNDGSIIASCDADGVVKVWDTRMVCEMLQIDAGPHPINDLAFDRGGKCLTLASGDSTVKVFDIGPERACKGTLEGHSDGVLSVALEGHGHYMVTGSADKTFRLWSKEGSS